MTLLSRHALFQRPLSGKLALARHLYDQCGAFLMIDPAITGLLARLNRHRREVGERMSSANLPGICRQCGENNPTGGCCSAAMAEESDALLLLVNLLTGRKIATGYRPEPECPFLAEKGCCLHFKPMFCLNYLCHRLKTVTPPVQLPPLARATGRLLQTQYAMEQRLLGTFAEKGIIA